MTYIHNSKMINLTINEMYTVGEVHIYTYRRTDKYGGCDRGLDLIIKIYLISFNDNYIGDCPLVHMMM